ncbi:hypothetical protein L7F22_069107 [Adiantum nelumboides]|nr:hypothetical protein [Adiantum nelumboides]
MMQRFVVYMQQQQTVQQQYQLQERMRKACLANSRPKIVELQAQLGTNWLEFKKALKEKYFLEDSQCVTKQSFMKWINQKNKGLSARKLLRECEKKYEQLSSTEQRSIRSERVELFVQAADARLQKSLMQLLEDATGGMKKLAEEIQHNVALVDATTYGLHVYNKVDAEDSKAYGDLWPYTLTTAERGKVPRGKLSEVGNSIRETTGWSDPVDSLSVYAYIAKSKAHEAMVEKKRKCDKETSRTSKRATKASSRKEEGTPPKSTPEVDMEDAPKDKKQGKPRGPSYKLKSDIELATDLKKVFEECILNSKGLLKKEFEMKDLGELHYFPGLEVICTVEGIWLSQRQYALDMLSKYGMADCKPISMPLDVNTKLSAHDGDVLKDLTIYRKIVGSFIYLTTTRADLSYTMGLQSQFMQLPWKLPLDAMHRTLCYVRATLDHALFYVVDVPVELHGYTNVDWAGSTTDQWSTSGFMFTLGSGAINWSSKK